MIRFLLQSPHLSQAMKKQGILMNPVVNPVVSLVESPVTNPVTNPAVPQMTLRFSQICTSLSPFGQTQ